jgi:hypothetical protein
VLVQDRELEQSLSERDLFDPIPEIEELYERAKDKGLVSKFDTDTAMKLFPDAPNGIVPELHIDSVQFKKVLDAVRNRILEWSLQLETDGIVGDNITFTEEEKQTAKGNVTNYGTIIQGDNIVGSQVQKNSSGASQVRVEQGIDGEGLAKLLKIISDNLNALSLASENRKQIESELSTIRSQIESPRPSNSIVRQALMSIRNIAEGCVGSLIASGIIFEINKLLPL